jgi:hypothetical protein
MRRKIMLAIFAIASVLTVFFIARAVFFAFVWMDPDRGIHPIEPWMTPRYIARTYDIPRPEMQFILDLKPDETPRQPLESLAVARGVSVDMWIDAFNDYLDTRHPK